MWDRNIVWHLLGWDKVQKKMNDSMNLQKPTVKIEPHLKGLTIADFKITVGGEEMIVTKSQYNPFTGEYNLEWERFEQWRLIPGFQEKYSISSERNVRSNARTVRFKNGGIREVKESMKKIRSNAQGVEMVNLYDDGLKVTRAVSVLFENVWG